MLAALTFALLASAAETDAAPFEKEGWGWGVLPAVNYNSDEGLGLGVVGSFYRYNGHTSPYKTNIGAVAFFTTRGVQSHDIEIDALELAGGPLRILARTELNAWRTLPYCGLGVNSSCDEAAAGAAADLAGLTGQEREDFVRRYYFVRAISPNLRTEARWSFDAPEGAPVVSLFAVHKLTFLIPGDFGTDEPWAGSLYDVETGGGERGASSVLSLGVMADSRDFEPAPTKGFWVDGSVRGASRYWGSTYEFFGANVTARQYLTPVRDLTLATRLMADVLSGDPSTIDLATPGGAQRYEYLGGLNAGRGLRLHRFLVPVKTLLQPELRWTPLHLAPFGSDLDVTLLGFVDAAYIADGLDALAAGRVVAGEGGGLRLAFGGNFIIRGDVAVSEVEHWKPGLYIDIRNTF